MSDAQGTAWTYGDLESRANRLARFLISNGVEKGDAVAVWAQRNAPLVQALMGTLKAGAAFLILDPAYPAPRLVEYLRIGRPRPGSRCRARPRLLPRWRRWPPPSAAAGSIWPICF